MIRLVITMTGKSYSPRDEYRQFASESHTFKDLKEAKAWIREQYGNSKRQPMYRGDMGHKIGYVIGFRNADWSHSPVDKWLQQDWIEFQEVKDMVLV